MIVIDGKSQSGKSTLARHICKVFDPEYTTVFTVKELLEYLERCSETYYNDMENYRKSSIWGKFILFDEIEIAVSKARFWEERNQVLTKIISSYGFLKQSIICTLPNIRGLTDLILTNLNFRIHVKADFNEKHGKIFRTGFIKKAVWSDYKNKFIWITTEIHHIPWIEKDWTYEKRKADNFFKDSLPQWRKEILNAEKKGDRGVYDDPYLRPVASD